MLLLKPVPSKGNKITIIGEIIKIDVLGLGIGPSSGKSMTTLRKNRQTGILGGKPRMSVKEAGLEASILKRTRNVISCLSTFSLPQAGW